MKDFPKGKKNDPLWWLITVLLFVTGSMSAIGIVLAILNITGKLPPIPDLIHWLQDRFNDKGGTTASSGKVDPATGRVTWDEPKAEQSAEERLRREAKAAAEQVKRAAEEVRQAVSSAQQQTATPAPRRKKLLKKPRTGGFRIGLGITLAVLGLILAIYGAGNIAGLFMGQLVSFTGYILPMTLPAFLSYTAIGGVMLVAGILLIVFGGAARGRANRRYRRLSNLLQMLGSGAELSIQTIADMAGCTYNQATNDLQELIDRGYFEGMWLDRTAGMLRRRPFDAYERAPEQPSSEADAETLSQAERILRQIRADNDLIDDEIISQKIDVIEDLTRKIFAFQEKNPDRADENRTFMNYYLPQTLKLLETYARMEASGVDVANVHTTKQKISEGLDKLIGGFQRHLDKLYSSDVIDITADIRVMEQMLEKDGLTEDRFAR